MGNWKNLFTLFSSSSSLLAFFEILSNTAAQLVIVNYRIYYYMEESQRNRLNSLDPDKNFIYSENGFIDWMINKQEKNRNTAESYLSSIRTVFQTEFYLDVDNPFSKLSISFDKAKKISRKE